MRESVTNTVQNHTQKIPGTYFTVYNPGARSVGLVHSLEYYNHEGFTTSSKLSGGGGGGGRRNYNQPQASPNFTTSSKLGGGGGGGGDVTTIISHRLTWHYSFDAGS